VLEFDPPKQLAEIEGRRAVELKNIIHLAPVLTSGGSCDFVYPIVNNGVFPEILVVHCAFA
jgi:hypothetical protein